MAAIHTFYPGTGLLLCSRQIGVKSGMVGLSGNEHWDNSPAHPHDHLPIYFDELMYFIHNKVPQTNGQ
jgi:hypothetical protein